MNHGKFVIRKNNLLEYLGLPSNSFVQVKDDGENIEVYVISDKEHRGLTEKTDNDWSLRRMIIPLNKQQVERGVNFYVYSDLNAPMILKDVSESEAVQHVKDMNLDGEVSLVKSELLYYNYDNGNEGTHYEKEASSGTVKGGIIGDDIDLEEYYTKKIANELYKAWELLLGDNK